MPTYGKKKKTLASSFAISEESKTSIATSRPPSAHGRLDNVKSFLSKTRSRVTLDPEVGDDDDIHEKTSPATNRVPQMMRLASSKSTNAFEPISSDPLRPLLSSYEQLPETRTNLQATKTSLGVPDRPRTLMAKSSVPFSNDDLFNLDAPASRPGTSSTTAASSHEPQTSSNGAEKIHGKITNLMQQAAIQEEDTKRKAELYAEYPSRMSPFNWSKKAFVKATHAIRDRLNSYSTTSPTVQRSNLKSHRRRHHSSDMSLIDDTDEDDTDMRLTRRIAENRNLAKSKIQTMVGDGNAPRKPLPVYESMKSRSLRSGSEEDPFSDGFELPIFPLSKTEGKVGDIVNKKVHEKVRSQDQDQSGDQIDKTPTGLRQHLLKPKSTPTFSSKISGLAQHPNVMDFSSSPLGFSTPRVRLEPGLLAPDPKDDPEDLTRTPSILKFSFERRSLDETSMAQSTNSMSVTDGSQSVKRKSAQSDLRSPILQTSKKSKMASQSSIEEVGLEMHFDQKQTQLEKVPLSPKDKNITLNPSRDPVTGNRLTIFEIGRDTNLDNGKKARPRPIIGRRTSFPRPSSMFSNGRDMRPGLKRLTSIDADMMDIDELQRDDERFQIGRNLA